MRPKDIILSIRYGSQELQQAAVRLFAKYYPVKNKLRLTSSNKKHLKFYLNKLNKELRWNKKKTILKQLEILIKKSNAIAYYNKFIKSKDKQEISLRKEISLTIQDLQKKITYAHQCFINELKETNVNNYLMVTFYAKSISHFEQNVENLSIARKVILGINREHFRYRDVNYNYMSVPEISKDYHPHLHIFLYPHKELTDEEMIELEKKLEKNLKKADLFKEFDVKIKKLEINKYNYSSPLNNILNKMGGDIRGNKVLYYTFIKAFGRRKFFTHSKLEYSFTKLKKIMNILYKAEVFKDEKLKDLKINYYELVRMIKEDSIRFEILNSSNYISVSNFLDKELQFTNFVSQVRIRNITRPIKI